MVYGDWFLSRGRKDGSSQRGFFCKLSVVRRICVADTKRVSYCDLEFRHIGWHCNRRRDVMVDGFAKGLLMDATHRGGLLYGDAVAQRLRVDDIYSLWVS